jgi:hypothetical protein
MLTTNSLELPLDGGQYALSAHRLWEHTELGQINVFDTPIYERHNLNDAYAFIDIVRLVKGGYCLAGFTLAQLIDEKLPPAQQYQHEDALAAWSATQGKDTFKRAVKAHLKRHSQRQATRNPYKPFLPAAKSSDPFAVPYIYSNLQERLRTMGKTKAGQDQWFSTVSNFTQKGIRQEEIELALIYPVLNIDTAWVSYGVEQFTAEELIDLCQFKELQLSIVAMHRNAQTQLNFVPPPNKKHFRTQRQPKRPPDQVRQTVSYAPALGYRLEKVVCQSALWGEETIWQALTHSGQVIARTPEDTILKSSHEAENLAEAHAAERFPKQFAQGKYAQWAWTGGENYREWLITLPYYPRSYLSGHYNIRNVLAHVRCDIREGEQRERILMLQELQSDWVKQLRQAAHAGVNVHKDAVRPPFMKEWQSLVMKLVLLHAASEGLDAVAWTRGAHQSYRYRDISRANLNELYDRTLPKEVNRLLKPHGIVCEVMGAFVPVNYKITQTERGYEVSTESEHLGTAARLEDTREFVPDGGRELLYQVHGVKLNELVRRAILANGFPAWG